MGANIRSFCVTCHQRWEDCRCPTLKDRVKSFLAIAAKETTKSWAAELLLAQQERIQTLEKALSKAKIVWIEESGVLKEEFARRLLDHNAMIDTALIEYEHTKK